MGRGGFYFGGLGEKGSLVVVWAGEGSMYSIGLGRERLYFGAVSKDGFSCGDLGRARLYAAGVGREGF